MVKLISKKISSDGRIRIYFCGIKIINSKKKQYDIRGNGNKIIVVENGVENVLRPGKVIPGLNIRIAGNNNTIKIHKPISATNCFISIDNDDAYIEIGASPKLVNLNINAAHGCGQICTIGDGTTVYGATIKLCEHSGCIIGRDCMFSNSINIWATDGHSVLDYETNEILNHADKPVVIGDHVWIGEGARLTKRARIYDNSIVAGGAVCYRDYAEPNVIIAGNPGTIVKRNILWARPNPYKLELLNNTRS